MMMHKSKFSTTTMVLLRSHYAVRASPQARSPRVGAERSFRGGKAWMLALAADEPGLNAPPHPAAGSSFTAVDRCAHPCHLHVRSPGYPPLVLQILLQTSRKVSHLLTIAASKLRRRSARGHMASYIARETRRSRLSRRRLHTTVGQSGTTRAW